MQRPTKLAVFNKFLLFFSSSQSAAQSLLCTEPPRSCEEIVFRPTVEINFEFDCIKESRGLLGIYLYYSCQILVLLCLLLFATSQTASIAPPLAQQISLMTRSPDRRIEVDSGSEPKAQENCYISCKKCRIIYRYVDKTA